MNDRIKLKREVLVRDLLNNYRTDSGASDVYCQGVLVGVIAGMMATTSKTWTEALKTVALYMPDIECRELTERNVPESWLWKFLGEVFKTRARR